MTHTCCPPCRLRFEIVAYGNDRCPDCGGDLEPALACELLGYRLAGPADPGTVGQAIAAQAALPVPADE